MPNAHKSVEEKKLIEETKSKIDDQLEKLRTAVTDAKKYESDSMKSLNEAKECKMEFLKLTKTRAVISIAKKSLERISEIVLSTTEYVTVAKDEFETIKTKVEDDTFLNPIKETIEIMLAEQEKIIKQHAISVAKIAKEAHSLLANLTSITRDGIFTPLEINRTSHSRSPLGGLEPSQTSVRGR